jgi:hypothetical protein
VEPHRALLGDEAAINEYFARNHEVLTQGAAKTDVAVYQRNHPPPAAFSTYEESLPRHRRQPVHGRRQRRRRARQGGHLGSCKEL